MDNSKMIKVWRFRDAPQEYRDVVMKAPEGIRIVNATPGSALNCYPIMSLTDALEDGRLYCDRTLAHAAAG